MTLKVLGWASREAVMTFPKMEEHEGEMTLGEKEKISSLRPMEHPCGDNQEARRLGGKSAQEMPSATR